MTIARVNTAKVGTGSSGTSSLALPAITTTTGNLLPVFVRIYNTATVSSVTDTAGNTFTLRAAGPNQDPSIHILTAENITGNAANIITVNISTSLTFWWAYVLQYSGLALSSATDIASSSKTGTGVTDLVSNSFSTSQASEVVLVASSQNNFTTYTAGTDFTLIDGSIDGGGSTFGGIQEYITSSALSSYTAHMTSGITNQYNVAVLSLKGAAAATDVIPLYQRIGLGGPQSYGLRI